MDEFEFIGSLLAPLAKSEKGALSLKDDAALLSVPEGYALVVTKDALTEGVHFTGDEPPGMIARKLLRVNLSDLAAMGAIPRAYFLALMLPQSVGESWLTGFAEGLRSDGKTYGISLMGGDTTRTLGPLALSVTALGLVPQGQALLRSGAKPGDAVYVTGTIGDGALGLQVAKGTRAADTLLLDRYRLPVPRVKLGEALRGIATACIDISDGLVQDLGHVCGASGVGAVIHWPLVPLSPAAQAMLAVTENPQETVLAGGDDYELLFTAPPGRGPALAEAAQASATAVTFIGSVVKEKGVRVLDADGQEITLARKGYRHF